MRVEQLLKDLAGRHGEALDGLPWPSESDRWAELVFCLLNAVVDDAARCRELIAVLDDLGLLEPSRLMEAADRDTESHVVISYVMGRAGIPAGEASRARNMVAAAAGTINEKYGGKIQRYLRAKGESIRDELVDLIGGGQADDVDVRRAVAHWLQNALSLPLSINDRDVQAFCGSHKTDISEIMAAADSIDLNVALVDDLIRLDSTDLDDAEQGGVEAVPDPDRVG